jgi:hypothetical protein
MFTNSILDFHPDPKAANKSGSLAGIVPAETLNAKRRLPMLLAGSRERVEISSNWMGRTMPAEAGVTDLVPLTGPRSIAINGNRP